MQNIFVPSSSSLLIITHVCLCAVNSKTISDLFEEEFYSIGKDLLKTTTQKFIEELKDSKNMRFVLV